jgi:hypothetical protein
MLAWGVTTFEAAKRIVFGSRRRMAGTVYGTVVVMGSITAGSQGDADPWRLAVIVSTTVLVLWIAHVYAHALGESVERDKRLDRAELASVAGREFAIPLAAVGPVAALLLGAFGFVRETRAVWLALAIGVATLAVQGFRYARLERIGAVGTLASTATSAALGLVIVALEALLAH